MFTQLWYWMFVASSIFGMTCPKTSAIGGVLNLIGMIAKYAFIVLAFFCGAHWWYGLVLLATRLLLMVIVPRIDANNLTPGETLYSIIFSHIEPIVVLIMYISFF